MYILPVCTLAVFVTVYDRTIQQPYALAVQVNGKTVGYVANEEVFNLAREDVMGSESITPVRTRPTGPSSRAIPSRWRIRSWTRARTSR